MIHRTRVNAHQTRGHNRTHNLNDLGQCVYAVRTPDGYIKIGWTRSLGNRISGLGGVDALIGIRVGGTYAEEQALHRSLSGHAVKGREWYAETPTVIAVVNDMCADMGMPDI